MRQFGVSVALATAVLLILGILSGCPVQGSENTLIWGVPRDATGSDVTAAIPVVEGFLRDETGIDVSVRLHDDYTSLVDSLTAEEQPSDMVCIPTFSYLVASEAGAAEVAAASVRYGRTSYRSEIIVRADSGIDALSDLAGRTFLRPDPLSTGGWIIPSLMMAAAGLDLDADLAVVDAGNHAEVVAGVYAGSHSGVDVHAGGTYVDGRELLDPGGYPDVMTVVAVLAESVEIPNDGLAFGPAVSADVRSSIVTAIQTMADSSSADQLRTVTSWDDIVEVGDSFYDDFRQLLADAGVQPADYF